MIAAISPANKELVTNEFPVCHSQGELLYLIEKNNIKEVFIDKDLPGNLSAEAFIKVIKTKYPDVEVSVVESHIEPQVVNEKTTFTPNVIITITSVVIIQTLFSILIQYSILAPRNVIYAVIAGFATLMFFYGGYRWINSKISA